MGSRSRSAGRYQPASKRSLRPESFSRLRFAAPARAAVTAQSSTARSPAAWRLASASRSEECFLGYSLCAYSKRGGWFALLAQANRNGQLLPSGRRRFLSPAAAGSPRAAHKVVVRAMRPYLEQQFGNPFSKTYRSIPQGDRTCLVPASARAVSPGCCHPGQRCPLHRRFGCPANSRPAALSSLPRSGRGR
jgi:hypothetical protein